MLWNERLDFSILDQCQLSAGVVSTVCVPNHSNISVMGLVPTLWTCHVPVGSLFLTGRRHLGTLSVLVTGWPHCCFCPCCFKPKMTVTVEVLDVLSVPTGNKRISETSLAITSEFSTETQTLRKSGLCQSAILLLSALSMLGACMSLNRSCPPMVLSTNAEHGLRA